MIKVLKGRILKNGKLYEFHIFIHGKGDIMKELYKVLEQKLQQKGWVPERQIDFHGAS